MQYSMIIECTDEYYNTELEDGRTQFTMVVPSRFKYLWLSKLSDLQATDEEIEYYQNDDDDEVTVSS